MYGDPSIPKLFTLEEANALLPELQAGLRTLRGLRDRIVEFEKKKAVEELCWIREDDSIAPEGQKAIEELAQKQREYKDSFELEIERFNATGAQLKDLDEGLVDFFAARGENVIFLCWKEGEPYIQYWHDLEAGFAGRRPLDAFESDEDL